MLGYFRWWITFNKGVYSKRYVRWINLSIEQTFSDFECWAFFCFSFFFLSSLSFFLGFGVLFGHGCVPHRHTCGTHLDIPIYTYSSFKRSECVVLFVNRTLCMAKIEFGNNITHRKIHFYSINVCNMPWGIGVVGMYTHRYTGYTVHISRVCMYGKFTHLRNSNSINYLGCF